MIQSLSAWRTAIVACLAMVALVGSAVVPANAATWQGRFSVWRGGAFATQFWDYSCVGATIQIMLNLVHGRSDSSRRSQGNLLAFAQEQSRYPVTDQGADPEGWAAAMRRHGAGDDYGWSAHSTIEEALWTAARQMRETRKPIGLLVHLGRHAWVMTGFESTADPAETDDYEVTAAEVVGPLWPHGTLNGRPFDPGPRTWMNVRTLGRKFDQYLEPGHDVWRGKWVMIVPRASDVPRHDPQNPDANALPDLETPLGWTWVFQRLAARSAVRDFLWLH